MLGNLCLRAVPPHSDGRAERYQQINRKRPLPRIESIDAAGVRLAVVGGGPSVVHHLNALREWDGEIWAINATWGWLRKKGIASTFYSVDAGDKVTEWARGAKRAVLGDTCAGGVYTMLRKASVYIAELGAGRIPHGCSAASTAPMLSVAAGYDSVTFFGCEGSFENQSHVYRDEPEHLSRLRLTVGGKEYVTRPDLLVAVEFLAVMIRTYPARFMAAEGGLLPALVEHGSFEVTHVSPDIQFDTEAV